MVSSKALDSPECYTIAWIAALPIERAAATAMLDEEHAPPLGFIRHQTDTNVYTWGHIEGHNIVIASLAAGVYGTTSAATTASSLVASLPSIRIGLLVGIGGGIARPEKDLDIRLGDVVVSQPDGTTGGVCQYDLYKAKSGDIRERKGFLGRPPAVLLNALASIQAEHERNDSRVPDLLKEMIERNPKMGKKRGRNPGFLHQGVANDRLFKASYGHNSGPDCQGCNASGEVERDARDTIDPEIHYGIIASGNTLVKDASARDRIVADIGEACLCFEMEAAGLMNHFPCLVIRGICDYADAHKNDQWQRYASATAAAYAKELLTHVPVAEVLGAKRVLEVIQSVDSKLDVVQEIAMATKATADSIRLESRSERLRLWLQPPDLSANINHARQLRHEGTGVWFLEHTLFQSWKSGSCRHIWLYGLSGCGKTILSATILDHLAEENDRLVLKFFFDFNDSMQQTLDGMLRSLALQLNQSTTASAYLDELFSSCSEGRERPTTKALWDVIRKILITHVGVCIIVDAMDESTTRDALLSWIENVTSEPELQHIQLICTSRPEPEFHRHMPGLIGRSNCLLLDKNAVDADIRSYVAAQLRNQRAFQKMSTQIDLLDEIQRKVGNSADGMFRWAVCQMEGLATCATPKRVKFALDNLPKDLTTTYDRMLSSIPKESEPSSRRLLHFLMHVPRRLTVSEAKEIIATNIEVQPPVFDVDDRAFDDSEVLGFCPGFMTITDSFDEHGRLKKELHLAHFSVKEFLEAHVDFKQPEGSIVITRTCLIYLTSIGRGLDGSPEAYPMADYAAQLWPEHARLAEASELVFEEILAFLEDSGTFTRWASFYHKGILDHSIGSRLYYASLSGWVRVAQYLIAKGANPNERGRSFSSIFYGGVSRALDTASAQGHYDVVELLLQNGADVNSRGGKYGSALYAASSRGDLQCVELLIDHGAIVNAPSGISTGKYALGESNALGAASHRGFYNIAKLLIEKGARIDADALHSASFSGHTEILELLLLAGADANLKGGYWGTALQAASAQGHVEDVRLLLRYGADPNVKGGISNSALQAASRFGRVEIVKILLEHGADPDITDGFSSSALFVASSKGYVEITRLLLGKGAIVNADTVRNASADGHVEIVKLLSEKLS